MKMMRLEGRRGDAVKKEKELGKENMEGMNEWKAES